MATLAVVLASWIQLLVPQPCFDEFFIKFNFFDVPCIRLVISKCLGYAIIAGSTLVKVPQIVKILRAKSGEGISIVSTCLELAAIVSNLAYSYSKGYPFTAYGDAVFVYLQTLTIGVLILWYSSSTANTVGFLVAWLSMISFLLSPYAPPTLLWYLQSSTIINILIARLLQASTNVRRRSTGQLSIATYTLLFLGASARVFTSFTETGDPVVIGTYLTSSLCNGLILGQIWYYSPSPEAKEPHKKVQ